MVAGLEEITDGTVSIGGRDGQRPVAEGPRHRDGLPELRALPAPQRVATTSPSACGSARRRSTVVEERVAWAAKLLDLTPYLERKPKQLSGGQRQRVAMGRAIVRQPQVFLMDEPLSNLDAKLRVQMRGEIAKLQHELGTTTIYVTHDQVEAMTMGDRIAVMSGACSSRSTRRSGCTTSRRTCSSRASSARRR